MDTKSDFKFSRGMLSSIADELVHIIMSMDAPHYKSMFEQTRTHMSELENDMKKKQDRVMELESKVSLTINRNRFTLLNKNK